MFNLPLEMVYSVLTFLSYEDIIALEKAFPILEEQVYDMKLKKGKQKIGELKLRCKRGEPNLEKERVNSITS